MIFILLFAGRNENHIISTAKISDSKYNELVNGLSGVRIILLIFNQIMQAYDLIESCMSNLVRFREYPLHLDKFCVVLQVFL